MERRDFLKTLGFGAAASAFLSSTLAKATTLPAIGHTGSLQDVEHIVVFMQENRSFDHYFGHLRGVKGYNDRFPLTLPGGKPVWYQPRMEHPEDHILPFHLNTQKTSAQLLRDLDHSWASQHGAIAGGLYDAWPLNKTDMTMGYFQRADIPFHYALADAFTICDHYFCSLAGPTCPNRCMLWTGMIDPQGHHGGPLIDDTTCRDTQVNPLTWTTYAERLQNAGISWQVYQQRLREVDLIPRTLNALAHFRSFADAPEDSELYQRAMMVRTLIQLKEDVIRNRLPQVSWIVPVFEDSEHPSNPPAYGAMYIARVLDALTANPEVWGKTVLLLDYDENDGLFDHVPPPQPPTPVRPGKSTVSTEGEIHNVVNPDQDMLYTADQLPYGLGPRVPMMAISPWSKGGYVCSEVFDHTSVIRFIEQRFGVSEPNISPWRRAVCGDLTSAFDFSRHNDRMAPLPKTAGYRDMVYREATLPPPEVPATQENRIIPQETGVRPARPIPYDLDVVMRVQAGGMHLAFDNRSQTGVCCYAYWDASAELPQRYSMGAGDQLSDDIALPEGQALAMTIYGPNGFVRKVQGHGASDLHVSTHSEANGDIRVRLYNTGTETLPVQLRDKAYQQAARGFDLAAGQIQDVVWDLQGSHHWYDLGVDTPDHHWRLAGHIENGKDSFSDPANVAPVLA
ncbi:phosphocholine-specific phospholipase C [Acidithiobacillus sp.]|uniref:phosphocholine-specific phospholipase C n=1 Tax=Acidithiobacillus sp. TaxID=1872118 RepID=UPI0026294A05|nr:phospholipase C, phosphocholine-specific [Acidithiobacillus sp.]